MFWACEFNFLWPFHLFSVRHKKYSPQKNSCLEMMALFFPKAFEKEQVACLLAVCCCKQVALSLISPQNLLNNPCLCQSVSWEGLWPCYLHRSMRDLLQTIWQVSDLADLVVTAKVSTCFGVHVLHIFMQPKWFLVFKLTCSNTLFQLDAISSASPLTHPLMQSTVLVSAQRWFLPEQLSNSKPHSPDLTSQRKAMG